MIKPALKLDWCGHDAARYACEKWHYSGTMPVSKNARLGVWEDVRFVGCVVFALGASANLGSPYGLVGTECCELVRVALSAHTTAVSRILSIAVKLLRRQSPGLRLVVSFADTYHSRHGGIYQAANWVYAGRTSPGQMVRLAEGRLIDPRRYNGHGNRNAKWGHQRPRPLPLGAALIRTPAKHRYLMPLDAEIRARVLPLAKPYPKRATSIASDAPANHAGQGGATPTVALSPPAEGA